MAEAIRFGALREETEVPSYALGPIARLLAAGAVRGGVTNQINEQPPRKITVLLCCLQLCGVLRVVWNLFRPYFFLAAACLAVVYRKSLSRHPAALAVVVACLLLWAIRLGRDSAFRPSRKSACGVYFSRDGVMRELLEAAGVHQRWYKGPFWLWNGDHHTIFGSLLATANSPPCPPWERLLVQSPGKPSGDRFALDVAFPPGEQHVSKVALFLAGIGGDSKQVYAKTICGGLLSAGFAVMVANARGMGDSPKMTSPKYIFDPHDLSDVHATIELISVAFPGVPITLSGVSMGAIMALKYVTTMSSRLPVAVKSCVSVSGAFDMSFAAHPKYAHIYQPLIVPGLVSDLVYKYYSSLCSILGNRQVTKAVWSTRYCELIENGILPLVRDNSNDDSNSSTSELLPKHTYNTFPEFIVQGSVTATSLEEVGCPVLLVLARDDPLHIIEEAGLDRLNCTATNTRAWPNTKVVSHELSPEQKNIAVVLTETGGHVGWVDRKGESPFMRDTVVAFSDAAVQHDAGVVSPPHGGSENLRSVVSVPV